MNIYTAEEVARIRRAGRLLARTRSVLLKEARAGVKLRALDKLAEKLIKAEPDYQPAFLGYRPKGAKSAYPNSICASVNEIIVHGLPTDYALRDGDLLTIDLGVIYQGYYSDSAWTIGIGKISPIARKLLEVGPKCLAKAISEARPGKTLGDIGYAVQSTVERAGFRVANGLTGHGIGKNLHELPNVLNVGRPGEGLPLTPGMVIAIEPMITAGGPELKLMPDDGYATADGSLSVHFEHTVAITAAGPEVLTE